MELIRCKENVVKKLNEFVQVTPPVILFKKGNMYPIKMDINYNWIATDEQGHEHIVASNTKNVQDDYWFSYHFDLY
ncbi:hypothetical protein ABFY54_17140 [Priestia megaterium]|uniref:Uncharacterized protein n=2 Tax=Priestia TaxID=2800373 RepID=A0AAX6BLW9_PRIMG|nr:MULTISPECIES: hypothetical protein [Priestia]MBK0293338.1 hypothetical protein [Bacillus sp. S34]UPK51966.1 hypothetical protein MT476_10320 [Bacillus sp. H8-1]AWD67963.1 hypothetical protein C2I28_23865 [Priestia megaterium]MBY0211775.1 hypothetical protein [Priestia aryabhattai]MCA1050613.1 hypothetical protein [Priestia aryabhattai]